MRKVLLIVALAAGVMANAGAANAQTTVALKLDLSRKSTIAWNLLCGDDYNCSMERDEAEKSSGSKDNVLAKVRRVGRNYEVLIDTNQDGRLTDERPIFLRHSSSTLVRIRKQVAAKRFVLRPFEITHVVDDEDGVIRDYFRMTPHYVAVGRLRNRGCSAQVALSDLNSDGSFTLADSKNGTNLGLDRNRDGKFWGKGEFAKTSELIEFCGHNYVVSSLNNRTMLLQPTALAFAKLNESTPPFSLTLVGGDTISSENLKGRPYVLDFWASWCVPCVKNLPTIKRIKAQYDAISIYAVNVDEPSRREKAVAIIDGEQLREVSVIRGFGDADPLWQTFGGMDANHLSIPLYVLVDKDGIIRYAGGGGDELHELTAQIEKLSLPK